MKKSILFLLTIAAFLFAGCKNYDADIDDLNARVAALEAWQKTVNENITSLQGLVTAVQGKDYVTGVVPLAGGGGYQITFQNSGTITIKNGTDGTNGADGTTPVIGVAKYTDGNYYWTVNTGSGATWLKDAEGNMIRTTGDTGATGAAGKDAVAPQVQINTTTGMWEISVNGGTTWTSTNVKAAGEQGAKGDKGEQGDAVFAKDGVKVGKTSVTFTLADGKTTFTLPLSQAMKIAPDITDDIIEFSKAIPSRVLKLTLPTGLKQSDFTSILAEVKCVNGTSTDIQTRAVSTTDIWGCKLAMPTYQADGTCNDDASVTVTKPDTWSPDNSTALLLVTLTMKDGTTLTSSRTLGRLVVYAVGYQWNKAGRVVAMLWENGTATELTDGTNDAYADAITVSGGSVYVAGFSNNVATVWKDGTIYQTLKDGTYNTYAHAIVVSGGSVYVAGNESDGTNYAAKVWKDGTIYQTLKDGTNNTNATSIAVSGDNVYVAGYSYNSSGVYNALLWTNGTLTRQSTDGVAKSVVLSGSNVYVAGYEDTASARIATLWEDGNATALTDGTKYAEARAIVVSGSDVYVAGEDNNVVTEWKNGSLDKTLTDGKNNAYAYSIALSGNDVYVSGYENNGMNVAKVWKNGTLDKTLTDGKNNAEANSIALSGSDVYVAGYEYKTAKVWKNDALDKTLTDGTHDAEAYSIALSGSDVYVAGYEWNETHSVAKVWKNGALDKTLTDGTHDAFAISIVVSGSDVYVAGEDNNVVTVWKNGTEYKKLTDGTHRAYANSIAVSGGDVYVGGLENNGTASVAKIWKNGKVYQILGNGTQHSSVAGIALVGK